MTQPRAMSQMEFIAMIAMMFATVAFSIDALLPALPEIAAEFSPEAPNKAQLILTSFVFGMGIGTFFTGPLSDTFGRRPVIVAGAAVYIAASLLAMVAPTLELVLAARVLQGLGTAGPRVVALAIVRDQYEGRRMAQIMSFAMMVFTLVPAIAPLLGAGVIALSGWHGIFGAFIAFSVISVGWLLRQPETLPPARRRAFRLALLWGAVCEMFAHPVVRLSILVQSLCMGILFTMLSMVQPVYDVTFGRAESFPFWFGVVAVFAGSASLVNAALVMRLGMRFLVTATLGGQVVISAVMLLLSVALPEGLSFPPFVLWQVSIFFMAGLVLGNLNALAMEPMGHIAGTAASVIGAVATVSGAILAAPMGLMFDGTPFWLTFAILTEASLALVLMRYMAIRDREAV